MASTVSMAIAAIAAIAAITAIMVITANAGIIDNCPYNYNCQ